MCRPALVLGEDVDLARLEVGVRRDRARPGENLAALDLLALDAAEQRARVVAGLSVVERLVEHLKPGDDGLLDLRVNPDDLDLVAGLDLALLDAARDHRAAARDREHVLDRHEERLVDVALRLQDVLVHGRHELEDLLLSLLVSSSAFSAEPVDQDVIAGELVLGQELADIHLDSSSSSGSSTMSALLRKTTMYGTSTWRASRMCSRVCGIGPSAAGDQDRAVHLRGTVIMFLM